MQHFLPNGQQLLIRPAKPEDAPAMLAGFREMTQETDFLLYTHEEATAIDLAAEQAFVASFGDNSRHLLLLAEVDGAIAGSITVKQGSFLKQRHTGEFGVALLRRYWNLGIGRRLITAMLRWATVHPEIEIIHMEVLAGNEKSIQLYRNFDFIEYGRRPQGIRQPNGVYADLILMYKKVK
jgi:RimJ/RimL family protein N-acetyltransferase